MPRKDFFVDVRRDRYDRFSDNKDGEDEEDVESSSVEDSTEIADILYQVTWEKDDCLGRYICGEEPFQNVKALDILVAQEERKEHTVLTVVIEARDTRQTTSHRRDNSRYRSITPPARRPRGVRNNLTPVPARVLLSRSLLDYKKPVKDFQPQVVRVKSVNIHSSAIAEILRDMITTYPDQILTGSPIIIEKPFPILMHYYHDLVKLRFDYESKQIGDSPADIAKHHDLTVLLDYLTPDYLREILPEEENYKNGLASFDKLWLLFKPGTDIYLKNKDGVSGFVVDSVSPRYTTDDAGILQRWCVMCWRFSYVDRRLERVPMEVSIDAFQGEKEITALPVFPSVYLDQIPGDTTRHMLEERGKRYFDLLKEAPRHLLHGGIAFAGAVKLFHEGEIIVDPDSEAEQRHLAEARSERYRYQPPEDSRGRRRRNPPGDWIDPPEPVLYLDENDDYWDSYKTINPKETTSLTPHQYFLLPSFIYGFSLKLKRWMEYDVDNVEEIPVRPEGNNAMQSLILDKNDISIIKALASRNLKEKEKSWNTDFIVGKGSSQIFLLHGPPGTGKTFTVECVAEYTRRPLLCLTVADIGTRETTMEGYLSNWFNLAARWDAILLIDEAEIFLEKRQKADLARNSLVSVFLRTMEYYRGMLFLTTNRVGHIDDAFLSRIQVAITYKKLDTNAQKQIWHGFFEKLKKERSDLEITWEAKDYISKEENLEAMNMNGRDIRNALQIAIALAQDGAVERGDGVIQIKEDHLKQVVARRKQFVEYTDKIRGKDDYEITLDE